MPWVRFDDQFPIHRKVDGLSDAAYRLHSSAIFWCARNLTDGFVSDEDLDGVTARVRTPARFAAECVKRGVWHAARTECPSSKCPGPVDADGWVIHDYWDYQPTAEKVRADRGAAADRQQKWRDSHRKSPRNAVTNGVSHGVSASSPSRPLLKEGGVPSAPLRGAPPPTPEHHAQAPRDSPAACGLHDEPQPCRRCFAEGQAAATAAQPAPRTPVPTARPRADPHPLATAGPDAAYDHAQDILRRLPLGDLDPLLTQARACLATDGNRTPSTREITLRAAHLATTDQPELESDTT